MGLVAGTSLCGLGHCLQLIDEYITNGLLVEIMFGRLLGGVLNLSAFSGYHSWSCFPLSLGCFAFAFIHCFGYDVCSVCSSSCCFLRYSWCCWCSCCCCCCGDGCARCGGCRCCCCCGGSGQHLGILAKRQTSCTVECLLVFGWFRGYTLWFLKDTHSIYNSNKNGHRQRAKGGEGIGD